ncbi:MAG: prolyl oligopeptidase family serine peptidase [Ignavibacteriales bacterium]|nr:prolyl oligopeptidase family serine peptidase [Ignavibacteriales bacterium]
MFGQLASWGFVVFASSYRASFNDELHDEFGGSDVDDILNLMEIANDIPFADTSRWAMEGWSRGGMMTYLALRKRHDVKVAIISGGITDVAECCLNVPRIREALQQLVEIEGIGVYEKRSAIHFADELPKDCKYLIIHGTKDETVSPLQAIKIAEKLLEQKLHFRLVLLEEADHFLKGKKKIVDELRREWLLKNTRGQVTESRSHRVTGEASHEVTESQILMVFPRGFFFTYSSEQSLNESIDHVPDVG